MQLGGSFDPLWLDWTILTDGYLVSFNPIHTAKNMLSTGLTLQYDLVAGNTINFASNALDWSLKWKHRTEERMYLLPRTVLLSGFDGQFWTKEV
jgi:hypothetical protein